MNRQSKGRTVSYHEHKFQYRSCRTNKHHILAESRGGQKTTRNLLTIEIFRHQAFHYLFQHRTLQEAAEYLITVKSFNRRNYYCQEAYYLLFGEKTFIEAAELLYRTHRAKQRQSND